MKSSLMANATRKISSRRRGKYKMVTYKDLKAQYGAGVAKTLRDAKKDLEQSKAATDTTTYWCEHPDFKGLNKEDRNGSIWYDIYLAGIIICLRTLSIYIYTSTREY